MRPFKIVLYILLIAILTDGWMRVIRISDNVEQASSQSSLLIKEQRLFLKQQQDLWNNKKTQDSIGLMLRQGNEFAKFMDEMQQGAKNFRQVSLDLSTLSNNVSGLISDVRGNTLPPINHAGERAAKLLDAGTDVFDSGRKAIDSANVLINRSEIPQLLQVSTDALRNVSKTADSVNSSVVMINGHLPSLLDKSDNTLANISGITFQFNVALERFNKPLTTRQKIASFFTETLIKSSPVLLKR